MTDDDISTRFSTTTTTMATRRPLSDAENLAVGAFGGIVETCVQSACASKRDRCDATHGRSTVDDDEYEWIWMIARGSTRGE